MLTKNLTHERNFHLYLYIITNSTYLEGLNNTHPLATSCLKASMWPSNAAHNVGVMPSSSLVLQSFLVASFNISIIFSLAALQIKKKD